MRTFRTLLSPAFAALAATALYLAACGGGSGADVGGGGGPTSTKGSLKISVTDAPFPSSFVESASVVIREVRVHEVGGDAWTTVFTGSSTIDLVPLTGGVEQLLVDAEIEPGTYDMVRLIVEGGEVKLSPDAVVADDAIFNVADGDLLFPSGAQSGIKLKIDNDIVVVTELSSELVLDFDLSKSFVFNGPFTHQPGVKRVIFKPVIRATNASTNGSLELDVASDSGTPDDASDDVPIEGATVTVHDAADVQVTMGLTDAAGHFATGLPPGTYTVHVEADGHDPASIPDVEIVLANVTDLGTITLASTEVEITGVVLSDGATPDDAADDTNVDGALVEAIVTGDATHTVVGSAATDLNGAFVLGSLAPGTYDLVVSKPGWTTQTVGGVEGQTPGGGGPGTTILLVALTQDLNGTVSASDLTPKAGVIVRIENALGQVIATSAPTDAAGAYTIAGVPSGSHALKADDGVTLVAQAITVVGTDPVSTQTIDVSFP